MFRCVLLAVLCLTALSAATAAPRSNRLDSAEQPATNNQILQSQEKRNTQMFQEFFKWQKNQNTQLFKEFLKWQKKPTQIKSTQKKPVRRKHTRKRSIQIMPVRTNVVQKKPERTNVVQKKPVRTNFVEKTPVQTKPAGNISESLTSWWRRKFR